MEDKDPKILEISSIDSYREVLARESLHESLQEALESLPEMYRQVLTLYYLSGMGYKEIARFLGTSPMTILQRLHRARSKLKEEMLAMMTTDFEAQRLPGGFTFRILEAVKRIRIQPIPRVTGLPWGLSFAAGIIIALVSFGPHLRILNPAIPPTGSPSPVETKVLKAGEIPVDILEISHIPFIVSKRGDTDNRIPKLPEPHKAPLMVAHGEQGTWTPKADMPTARAYFSISVVNGKIYAIGGYGSGEVLSTVEEYDPAMGKWARKADMPTARVGLATAVVNGRIYAIGGWDRIKTPAAVCSTVEEYNPMIDTWTKKADMLTARGALSASAVNGKVYAIGGQSSGGWATPVIEEYDPVTDTWTKKADMPTARGNLSTTVINGRIYAIGGVNREFVILSTMEEYHPAADRWIEKANMAIARYNLSTSAANGKIYAIGGWGHGTHRHPSAVEEYDPLTDMWIRKADMTTPRGGLSTGVVDGKIYVIGGKGLKNVLLPTVEEYDIGSSD